jgi:glycosyltransferase involved in cell wall biosynthesis
MRFSIVTPSFNPSHWLPMCIASVADQGVELEHIVQDAGSNDGTLDWLRTDTRVKAFIEKDGGMYDAVNRGLRRTTGDILAYLNCDEQYLPGALRSVDDYFRAHPGVDVVFGDFIVVNGACEYMFHRKVQTPMKYHTWVSHLPTLTCAMFFRRRIIDEYGEFFDTRFRDVGDAEWVLRLLRRGVRMGVMRQFTSVFAMTGENMSSKPNAVRERKALQDSAPFPARALKPLIILYHRLRRLAGGIYRQEPFSYRIYSKDRLASRATFEVAHPRFRWRTSEAAAQ